MKFNPFRRKYSTQEKRQFAFLRKNYLFQSLKDEELSEFLPYLYPRKYGKNEVVFFRGDPSQALYIVGRGTVSLTIDIEEKFEEITRLSRGDSFGDNALLTSTKRIYNAISISDPCELFVIPSTNFREVLEDDVKIKAKILEAIAKEHNRYMEALFRTYQEAFGFFDLNQTFDMARRGL